VIREKNCPKYTVEEGLDITEDSNILRDQTVRFTGKRNVENLSKPNTPHCSVYTGTESVVYILTQTTSTSLLEQIVFLYKKRWLVELFFYDKHIIM